MSCANDLLDAQRPEQSADTAPERGRPNRLRSLAGRTRSIRNSNAGVTYIPDPAGADPFTFPYLPMSLPWELGQHFGLGASIAATDRCTSEQIFALHDECVFEHRFRPEPVFLIRSNGTAPL